MSVLVFAESHEGAFKKAAFEAVSYAAQLGVKLGLPVTAVSIGNVDESKLKELGTYGANKVLFINNDKAKNATPQASASAIAHAAKTAAAKVVVISNTYTGKSIAPRVAVKLGAGIVSGVVSLPETNGGFKVKKTAYSGKAFAEVSINTETKVIALTPNSIPLTTVNANAEISAMDYTFDEKDFAVQTVEVKKASGKIPLTEAEIVVSGGRGMKGPENWGMIEELAGILGAATACSKPVADMDWRPHEEHVGQTGITIKPNLYIAAGISGAIQHLAGVSSSKVIVAINKDPEAPMFKIADYGIVGDVMEIFPKLINAAKDLKASH
jgi:electron transfer flavoprotein alpha subunit